jgi:hypothetical protein
MNDRPLLSGRLVFGLVVLMLGVLWTLDNLGQIDASRVLAWWPAVALAWGLMQLTGLGVRRCYTTGWIWVVIGTFAGLDKLRIWPFSPLDLVPLFLVAVGGVIVSRAWRGRSAGDAVDPGGIGGPGGMGGMGVAAGPGAGSPGRSATEGGARANWFAFLSGTERRVSTQEFAGGEASAILGGLSLDLRGARMAHDRAVLDLFAMWGGIEIIAPAGWRVVSRVTPLLGAFVDSMPPVAPDGAPTLELRGLAVMGGVDVRSDDAVRRKVRHAVIGAQIGPGITVAVADLRRRARGLGDDAGGDAGDDTGGDAGAGPPRRGPED